MWFHINDSSPVLMEAAHERGLMVKGRNEEGEMQREKIKKREVRQRSRIKQTQN